MPKVIIALAIIIALILWGPDDTSTCEMYYSFDTCAHTLWR